MKGIDVSVWNGDIDYKKVKVSGIDFVIIRAGFGSLLKQKDLKFEDNYRKAKAAGLLIGFYWYSYGEETQDFINEARTCLEVIKGKEHELPIYFDLEEQSQLRRGKDFCSAAVKTFCNEIRKTGKETGLYISRYYLQTVIDEEIKTWPHLWVAEYDVKLNYDGPYEIWQKTSIASVPGIDGHCDLNESTVAFSLPKTKEDITMSRQSAYEKMRSELLGRSIDVDGYYGPQCWDLGVYAMKNYYGGHVIHCGQSGYAKDIANQRRSNGILNFCTDVGLNSPLQPGDICIWGDCPACPVSHIAIYDHDDGQNAVYFLGQNQGPVPGRVSIDRIPVNGIIGVFRPKHIKGEGDAKPKAAPKPKNGAVLNSIPSDFHRENATFTVTANKIHIRQAPSVSGKDTGLYYARGQSVNYDGYVIREGFTWISWISASTHTRRWMACGENHGGRTTVPYGTFH